MIIPLILSADIAETNNNKNKPKISIEKKRNKKGKIKMNEFDIIYVKQIDELNLE